MLVSRGEARDVQKPVNKTVPAAVQPKTAIVLRLRNLG